MSSQRSSVGRVGQVLLIVGLAAVPALAGPIGDVAISPSAESMLKRALGADAAAAAAGGGRALFEEVLASAAFRSGSVGPFDVHVLAGRGASGRTSAESVLDSVLATLAPAAEVVGQRWPAGGAGLISATRFPVVITADHGDYLQLVALLDHCERAGYSGWYPANTLDSTDVRAAEVARTWEVQVFDLTAGCIAERRNAWLKHGVGYYTLAFVANRALRQGSWGLVPPWLSSGLTDELDIAAYGRAWVGQESWSAQTPGWSHSGWSGFVPKGARPPAPITGPPADLAVTVQKTGDSWLDFDASRTRHWSELVTDLKTEAPASFARAAETESFLPRDRAAARCLLHLMLTGADGSAEFSRLLDRPVSTPADGMPDSDPLPVIFARALGGVSDVNRLEALDARSLLTELGRKDLIDQLEQAGAGDALALSDHRAQSAWLYGHGCDGETRAKLFQAFLEIEYVQQMAEWKALGPHLDAGLRDALKACKAYPVKDRDVAAAAQAFRTGLAAPAADTAVVAKATKGKVKVSGNSASRK